jgi:hypothetical protein
MGYILTPIAVEWADKADQALASAGVAEEAVRLMQLMNRGAPVPLPLIEVFASVCRTRCGALSYCPGA